MYSVILAFALLAAYPPLESGDHRFGIGDGYVAHRGTLTFEKLAGRGGLVDAWLYRDAVQVDRYSWSVPPGLTTWTTEFTSAGYNAVTFRGLEALKGDKESPFQPLDYTIEPAAVPLVLPEPGGFVLSLLGCGLLACARFRRGQIVKHVLTGDRFIVLRRVLLPVGGYLVRCMSLKRHRLRRYELQECFDPRPLPDVRHC